MRRAAVVCLVLTALSLSSAAALGQADEEDPAEMSVVTESPAEGEATSEEPEGDLPSSSGAWWVEVIGYVRAGVEFVQNDPNNDFVGENNGFVLQNARIGAQGGHAGVRFSWRITVEGAADVRENINIPEGRLDVRLRDAFIREDLISWLGLQLGQFKVPFSGEEMLATDDLDFASRAVGLEGVRVGRGYEQPGLFFDRQLGLMISSGEPYYWGDFGLAYYFMVANGNGANQILNDNNFFGYYGRLELYYSDLLRVAGAALTNRRTVGELPNQFDEVDQGWTVDLQVTWEGLQVYGQYTALRTEFRTTGSPTQDQVEWHAQAVYLFDFEPLPFFGPAYRIAFFDPRAEGGIDDAGVSLDQYRLLYHTFGFNVMLRDLPVLAIINYTLTVEEEPRELENNRFELLGQVVF